MSTDFKIAGKSIEELIKSGEYHRLIAEWRRNEELAAEHPYVSDLIHILMEFPAGRPRRRVLELLERQRSDLGLPIPTTFQETVQASYNRHCENSEIFKKKRASDEKPLFHSPGGKGSGNWAVYNENAIDWLARTMRPT